MKNRGLNWKKWLLIPVLCLTLLAAGCSGRKAYEDVQAQQSGQEEAEEDSLQDTDHADSGSAVQEEGSGQEDGTGDIADDDSGGGSGQENEGELSRNGVYTTAEDVALYLHTYGTLPVNFMTKKEARSKGWSGGSLEEVAPGMCIGGDRFGNYEGVLPEGSYHECDINTLGKEKRGAERLVYSDDGRIYYTKDHYESFTLLYGKE